MIFGFLFKPFWIFISFIIKMFGDEMAEIPNWYWSFQSLLQVGLKVFPPDVWVAVIGNIVFWMGIHLIWAVIEWIYKKIPGVS